MRCLVVCAALVAGHQAWADPLPACTNSSPTSDPLVVTDDDIRFCTTDNMHRECWRFAIATSTVTPNVSFLAPIPRTPDALWRVERDDQVITICGPLCKPFTVIPGDPITDVAIDASGLLVAVARVGTKMTVDIYDRAAARRLAVVKPRETCTRLDGFAGTTLVLAVSDCTSASDRILVSPAGVTLARMAMSGGVFHRITADRWTFFDSHGAVSIVDVATGKRVTHVELLPYPQVSVRAGRVHLVDDRNHVVVLDADGKQVARARVPPCRWEWETQAIGPLRLRMSTDEVVAALGKPTVTPSRNTMRTVWTYPGVRLVVRADEADIATGKPVPPFRVEGIAIAAPSKLRTVENIGIGSTIDELHAAYRAHEIASRVTAKQYVAGNPGEADGILFRLDTGKIVGIEVGLLEAD